ncbi:MAG: 4Fe-4S dicluster domain-containing protein [bacterium]|nr:4Fe-4S dicluster domain-containing protein [bacterium]
MSSFAILTDVTRCTGCEECVLACKSLNETGDRDAPRKWQGKATDLSSTRWTTIAHTEDRHVRVHCRHCLEPACAAACPVKALHTTEEGVVAYDPSICLGCRYCMMACPFSMTRYEWESANPRVRKCILCYDKMKAGEIKEPGCTAACPEKATIFGERDALLVEANRRIKDRPDLYLDHVWGEHEVGGTSVLYISDVDLASAGWPADLTNDGVPHLADKVLETVPTTFAGVGLAMAGIHWVIGRRNKLAAEAAAAHAAAEAENTVDTPEDEEQS